MIGWPRKLVDALLPYGTKLELIAGWSLASMFVSAARDMVRALLERWRVVQDFYYLLKAPFAMKPSDFREQRQRPSPYKALGWKAPLYAALIWAFSSKIVMKPVVEMMKSGPEDDAGATILRDTADWVIHGTTISTLVLIVCLISVGSWMFHGAMCWIFRSVFKQEATNAPFEFYFVRWSSVWTWFSLTTIPMFVPAYAEHGEGTLRLIAEWLIAYPEFIVVLFLVLALPWWLAVYNTDFGRGEVYKTAKQMRLALLVQFSLALVPFLWLFYEARSVAGPIY